MYHSLRPFLLLVTWWLCWQDWTNQEFSSVDNIPPWLSMLICHWGMNKRSVGGRSSDVVSPYRHDHHHLYGCHVLPLVSLTDWLGDVASSVCVFVITCSLYFVRYRTSEFTFGWRAKCWYAPHYKFSCERNSVLQIFEKRQRTVQIESEMGGECGTRGTNNTCMWTGKENRKRTLEIKWFVWVRIRALARAVTNLRVP
jgi:hypothetical protein